MLSNNINPTETSNLFSMLASERVESPPPMESSSIPGLGSPETGIQNKRSPEIENFSNLLQFARMADETKAQDQGGLKEIQLLSAKDGSAEEETTKLGISEEAAQTENLSKLLAAFSLPVAEKAPQEPSQNLQGPERNAPRAIPKEISSHPSNDILGKLFHSLSNSLNVDQVQKQNFISEQSFAENPLDVSLEEAISAEMPLAFSPSKPLASKNERRFFSTEDLVRLNGSNNPNTALQKDMIPNESVALENKTSPQKSKELEKTSFELKLGSQTKTQDNTKQELNSPLDLQSGLQMNPVQFTGKTESKTNGKDVSVAGVKSKAPREIKNLDNIMSQVSTLAEKGGGTVRIQLDPAHLGHITLTVSSTNIDKKTGRSEIVVEITTANGDAKKQIEDKIADLKTKLESGSFNVAKIEVRNTEEAQNFMASLTEHKAGKGIQGISGLDYSNLVQETLKTNSTESRTMDFKQDHQQQNSNQNQDSLTDSRQYRENSKKQREALWEEMMG